MLNRVILMGRLTADPELKQTPNGISVTSFSLAVDRNFTSRGAERQTDFINCVAWRQTAEFISRYFAKGRMMAVEGSLQVRNYVDKNENKRQAVEVVVDQAYFADSKNAAPSSSPAPSYQSAAPAYAPAAPVAFNAGSVEDFQEIDDEDDLPF
ncbi:MAG: single-stranded DNA-binding protein [Ruminococcaceae bacterium]|nr:single-stranded DNA-binding protein [Oscillospiraceae bacterium]MBQ9970068.1 single-stranded DNA-binding protein [Oscillospiraceae bacterium]